MRNLKQTVAAAANRIPPGRPFAFTAKEEPEILDLRPVMKEVTPYLNYSSNGPYEAAHDLVRKGVFRNCGHSPVLHFERIATASDQSELPFAENGRPSTEEDLHFERAAPNAVLNATWRAIQAHPEGGFTSSALAGTIRWQSPETYRVMNPSSISSALKTLEHRGLVRRAGKRGRCILWQRVGAGATPA